MTHDHRRATERVLVCRQDVCTPDMWWCNSGLFARDTEPGRERSQVETFFRFAGAGLPIHGRAAAPMPGGSQACEHDARAAAMRQRYDGVCLIRVSPSPALFSANERRLTTDRCSLPHASSATHVPAPGTQKVSAPPVASSKDRVHILCTGYASTMV